MDAPPTPITTCQPEGAGIRGRFVAAIELGVGCLAQEPLKPRAEFYQRVFEARRSRVTTHDKNDRFLIEYRSFSLFFEQLC